MLELTIRLVVSLAVVVGLLLVLARLGAKKFRGGSGALVHVVHRQPLSRTSAVAVVTVGSRVLVLGTTEHQISVLAELEPDDLDLGEVIELDTYESSVDPHPTAALTLLSEPDESDVTTPAAPDARAPRSHRGSHRAAPARKTAMQHAPQPVAATGPLAGSVLSASTWKQAFTVATSRNPARGPARRSS
ncbi:MAG: hypothetical protein JWQ74_517 [Marmoricola sp.]|nr:hypothetical protein [Marmoricola sp.]